MRLAQLGAGLGEHDVSRPAVATVVSPRPWEGRLVQAATDSGLVRVTTRGFNPTDIHDVDAVVVGSEVPWLRSRNVVEWRASSIAVIGIYPSGDRPAIARFCAARVDQLFVDDTDPMVILRAIRDIVGADYRFRQAVVGPVLGRSRAI